MENKIGSTKKEFLKMLEKLTELNLKGVILKEIKIYGDENEYDLEMIYEEKNKSWNLSLKKIIRKTKLYKE